MTVKKKNTTTHHESSVRNDFTDTVGNIAAGFMMASAMDRLKRALFTFTILPSGRVEIGGQWIDFLRKRFHEGETIGIRLVDRLLGGRRNDFPPFYQAGPTMPPRPATATDKLWGKTRLCICPSRKSEQLAGHKFCEHCGGSIVPLTFRCDKCELERMMGVGKVIGDRIYCPTCYAIITPEKA